MEGTERVTNTHTSSPKIKVNTEEWMNKNVLVSIEYNEDNFDREYKIGEEVCGEFRESEWYGITRGNERNDTIYITVYDKVGNRS